MSDGNIFLILYGTVAWYFAGIMIRLMLTLAPIACILAAEGFSALLRRFMAYLRYSGEEVELQNEKKSAPTVSSSRVEVPSIAMPSVVSVLFVIYAMFVFYTMHCVFISSEAYSSPSIVIGTPPCPLSHSLLQPRRLAHHPRRLPRGVLLDAHEHRRARQVHVLVGLRLPDGGHGQPHGDRRQQHVEQHAHRHRRSGRHRLRSLTTRRSPAARRRRTRSSARWTWTTCS